MNKINVFAYGTLQSAMNLSILTGRDESSFSFKSAYINSYIKVHCRTAYVLPCLGQRVHGKLIEGLFEEDLPRLDDYECTAFDLYKRITLPIHLDTFNQVQGFVYVAGDNAPVWME